MDSKTDENNSDESTREYIENLPRTVSISCVGPEVEGERCEETSPVAPDDQEKQDDEEDKSADQDGHEGEKKPQQAAVSSDTGKKDCDREKKSDTASDIEIEGHDRQQKSARSSDTPGDDDQPCVSCVHTPPKTSDKSSDTLERMEKAQKQQGIKKDFAKFEAYKKECFEHKKKK